MMVERNYRVASCHGFDELATHCISEAGEKEYVMVEVSRERFRPRHLSPPDDTVLKPQSFDLAGKYRPCCAISNDCAREQNGLIDLRQCLQGQKYTFAWKQAADPKDFQTFEIRSLPRGRLDQELHWSSNIQHFLNSLLHRGGQPMRGSRSPLPQVLILRDQQYSVGIQECVRQITNQDKRAYEFHRPPAA